MKHIKVLCAFIIMVMLVWFSTWSCRDTIILSPPTLSVTLTADPVSGVAPLHWVDLTAQVNGTAKGPVTYRFDCTNDGVYDIEITTDADRYTAVDVCGYDNPGTYTVKVVVERAEVWADASINIIVAPTSLPPAPSDDSVMVSMQDNFFSPREVTVKPGTRIIWENVGNRPHTSTSDDGIWDSGTVNPGGEWGWTVPGETESGTALPYYCVFHGSKGGIGMAGVIHVSTESPPSQPTLSVSLSADPSSGEAPLQGVDLIAQVSGTVTGPIIYHFDCTNDGAFEHEVTTDSDFYIAVDVCTYNNTGTYTAKVVVDHGGLTAETTTTITVDEPPPLPTGNAVTVSMKDNFFSPREVTVQPGTKITWQNVGKKAHTSTSDDGIWDSGTVNEGGSWSWTVPVGTPLGTSFPYY